MAQLPTGNDWTTVANEGAAKGLFTDQADNLYARLGGTPEATLTIAAGVVDTNVGGVAVSNLRIDTAGGPADLNTILVDLFEDGQLVLVRAENPANVPTLKHSAGGAGQMTLVGGIDVALTNRDQGVLFYVNKQGAAVLEEIARFHLLVTTDADGFTTSPNGFSTDAQYAIRDAVVPTEFEGALRSNDLANGVMLLGQKAPGTGLSDAPVEVRGSEYIFGTEGQVTFIETAGSPLDPSRRYALELGPQVVLADGRLGRHLQVGQPIAEGGSESGTSNADVPLSAAYTEIVNVTVTTDYLVPSSVQYELVLEEVAANRSTQFEVEVRENGTPMMTTIYTVAGAQQPIDRYFPTSATIPNGATVSVWVRVLDTGQGRDSRIRGDVRASTVTVTQIA